jgi:hypothetical protein
MAKATKYRDREGALHFNVNIDEEELTAICQTLQRYVEDYRHSASAIRQRHVECAEDLIKTLENID